MSEELKEEFKRKIKTAILENVVGDVFKKNDDETVKTIGFVGAMGEALSKAPEKSSDALASALTTYFITQPKETTADKIMSMVAAMKALDKSEDSDTKELLKTLIEKITDIEAKYLDTKTKMTEEELRKERDELLQRLDEITQRLAPSSGEGGGPESPIDALKDIVNQLKQLDAIKKDLAEALGVSSKEKGEMSLEDAKKRLEALGYKVQGPVSADELEKLLQQVQKETERKIREEMKREEKKERILLEFLTSFLPNVMAGVGESAGTSSMESLKKAMKRTVSESGEKEG
jgi:hypothetical protein